MAISDAIIIVGSVIVDELEYLEKLANISQFGANIEQDGKKLFNKSKNIFKQGKNYIQQRAPQYKAALTDANSVTGKAINGIKQKATGNGLFGKGFRAVKKSVSKGGYINKAVTTIKNKAKGFATRALKHLI